MSAEEDISFDGKSASECERFVNLVRRQARAAGKLGDNKWIMDLVSCSLHGRALRWQMTLDPEVRSDWDSFQQALFVRWPLEDEEEGVGTIPATLAPIPAMAPKGKGLKLICDHEGPWTGYLKIDIPENPSFGSYVSAQTDIHGVFLTTWDRQNAMKVQFEPEAGAHLIRILNSPSNKSLLGAAPGWGYKIGDRLDSWVGISALAFANSEPEAKAMIWNVSPIDGSIRVTWPVKGTYVLTPIVRASSRRILLVPSWPVYKQAFKDILYYSASLSFEPTV